ncbi:MAG: hypothetical protein QHH80_14510, partial [Anaerolineae bacterium]|nr:hypothetical protein [Anaerolineae bacterium]
MRIGIVGVCGSGKTSLAWRLRQAGYEAAEIAQEHSYVPAMWQRLAKPDVLIFLDVAYPLSVKRRNLNWTVDEYNEQQRRLLHARQHADLVLDTDHLT